jgi:hypothetical protein
MTSTMKTASGSSSKVEAIFNMQTHEKLKTPKAGSFHIQENGDFSEEDTIIHKKLAELDARCIEITKSSPGQDADYATKVIRTICMEINLLQLKTKLDIPFPGWCSYDSELLRNIDSIVFKIDHLADKYFAESYKKYDFINDQSNCNSVDKLYQLADEWLSDRRTMVDLVSSMVDEIQDLGITPNPVSLKEPTTGD